MSHYYSDVNHSKYIKYNMKLLMNTVHRYVCALWILG